MKASYHEGFMNVLLSLLEGSARVAPRGWAEMAARHMCLCRTRDAACMERPWWSCI